MMKQAQNRGYFIDSRWIEDSIEDMEVKSFNSYIITREKQGI
jgi:hypothetical protein